MSQDVKQTLTLSTHQVIRIRERGTMERLGGKKFVLEYLSNGVFKTKNQYFDTLDAAEEVSNKIYCLDQLHQRKVRNASKVKPGFEDSIKGSYEYDFYDFLDTLVFDDYELHDQYESGPIASVSSNPVTPGQRRFLTKYNHPTNVLRYSISDFNGEYLFILKTPMTGKYIFNTDELLYNKHEGEHYKYLFESKLHISYSKFI